ncbi:uncharacterized protein LOC132737439 [Ruditapes philippinarum]|uniref:uncharacterized protein LOC132737439 n=1 Tax=Ruditapes philippinarum TaxID=129788 RepID=UPI00295BC62A|nr:uncharacterized protein LOC132737439 [Ruditapes philippinarum]XP_060580713.1 uncharacterized protein LOC132737439 [Ruditapes philippinarum]
MMMKLCCLTVLVVVFVARSNGQWPLGASFFNSMNRMASNMNAMATNLQIQGQQMALNRQQSIEADMLRSWEGAPFMTGGSVFITADGGLGYAYNSTDGSFTMYSLKSGSPPSGYMYHINAQGGTSFNSW